MQRRLFEELGAWAVMDDDDAAGDAAPALDEPARDLRPRPRPLRPRPGDAGRAQDHRPSTPSARSCCGASRWRPASRRASRCWRTRPRARSRRRRARTWRCAALDDAGGPDRPRPTATSRSSSTIGRFQRHVRRLRGRARARSSAYVEACEAPAASAPTSGAAAASTGTTAAVEIEAEAVARIRWGQWRRAAEALLAGHRGHRPAPAARRCCGVDRRRAVRRRLGVFCTKEGEPARRGWRPRRSSPAAARVAGRRAGSGWPRRRNAPRRRAIAEASVHALSLALRLRRALRRRQGRARRRSTSPT